MKRETPPAPRTLAAALKVAIADGRTLLDAPHGQYVFKADRWHDGSDPEAPCAICAAGAVMARTLGASPDEEVAPHRFDGDWGWALCTIDAMRRARWASAFAMMHLRERTGVNDEDTSRLAHMVAWEKDWKVVEGDIDWTFGEALENAIEAAPGTLARRWSGAGTFNNADGYRRFLDLAGHHILPIVTRCERDTLAHMQRTL